jgi:elongation factor Ts
MEISTDVVKALRDRTGVSVMQCRKALEEAEGDVEKAEVLLRRNAGYIGSYVHDGLIGAMVLLSSETDFVAKNPEFGALARELAMQVAATNPEYLTDADISEEKKAAAMEIFSKEVEGKPEEMKAKILEGKMASYFSGNVLMNQPYIKDEGKTVRDLLNEAAQKFGERIEISKFARFSAR